MEIVEHLDYWELPLIGFTTVGVDFSPYMICVHLELISEQMNIGDNEHHHKVKINIENPLSDGEKIILINTLNHELTKAIVTKKRGLGFRV